ncbi:hypothetical protein ACYOEI_01785 [Singulisphaera rosea]
MGTVDLLWHPIQSLDSLTNGVYIVVTNPAKVGENLYMSYDSYKKLSVTQQNDLLAKFGGGLLFDAAVGKVVPIVTSRAAAEAKTATAFVKRSLSELYKEVDRATTSALSPRLSFGGPGDVYVRNLSDDIHDLERKLDSPHRDFDPDDLDDLDAGELPPLKGTPWPNREKELFPSEMDIARKWGVKPLQVISPASLASYAGQSVKYIVSVTGKIFVIPRGFKTPDGVFEEISHAVAANGSDILAAGSVTVEGNVVLTINRFSGHYRPDAASVAIAKEAFRRAGFVFK